MIPLRILGLPDFSIVTLLISGYFLSNMKTSLTIEQSAELIKLGVGAKFATGETIVGGAVFALNDLIGLLPKKINYHSEILWLHIYASNLTEKWCAEYQSGSNIDEADTFQFANELVDCLYLLLKYLLTEKLALI